MRRSNRQGCFRWQAGYKGKKNGCGKGFPRLFYVERDCRGFCKGRLFCDVYVIWEKEGGFLTNFLIFTEGGGFVIPFSLQKQNFIVWSK